MHGPGVHSLPQRPLGVRLWQVRLGDAAEAGDVARDVASLSAEEQARAARFVFPRDRQRFVAAHLALHRVLHEVMGEGRGEAPTHRPPSLPLAFATGPHGKPHLPQQPRLAFNLSHSGEHALIGVAEQADIGVDIECRRPLSARTELDELAERCFTRAEQDELARSATPEDALDLFYTGWTRKEACLKALGTGLSLDPREVHVGLRHPSACVGVVLHGRQQRIHIVSLQLGDEVHAAVARCDTSA